MPNADQYARIPQLDGLRALAFALVTLSHMGVEMPFIAIGQAGVGIFFVLSSMLISSILLDLRSSAQEGNVPTLLALKNFYIRRILRLWPLLLFVILISVLTGTKPFPETWPWHVAYLTNLYQFLFGWEGYGSNLWTLSIEEQFYIAWPFIIFFSPLRKLPVIILTLFFIPILVRYLITGIEIVGPDRKGDPNLLPLAQLDCLCCGAYLACLQKGILSNAHLYLFRLTLPLAILLWTCLITIPNTGFVRESLVAIFWMWLVQRCSQPLAPWAKFTLSNPVMVYVGKISYGLYVIQGVVLGWFLWFMYSCPIPGYRLLPRLGLSNETFESHFFVTTTCLVLNFLIAIIFWHCIESPINSLKSRFPYISRPARTTT
jgi:peptidoglycan/LPS O-acetylase OafA/YrhL